MNVQNLRPKFRSTHDLKGLTLHALDGEIGSVEQVFFDDEKWTVRYLVVKTGSWLMGKKVLISPISIEKNQWDQNSIAVSLTRQQVEDSPDIDTDQPVSRQMEQRYSTYYRWPYYWTGAGIWGSGGYPAVLAGVNNPQLRHGEDAPWRVDRISNQQGDATQGTSGEDIHLRSSQEVIGYKLEAIDGEFGHVDDLILDDSSWKIRYLLIDTKNFWPSKYVLLPPDWVSSISWNSKRFRIDLEEAVIKKAPEFDSLQLLDRDLEKRIYAYYGRSGYWETESSFTEIRHPKKRAG